MELDNLDRLAAAYRGYLTLSFIHVRCDDPLKECLADPCDPNNPTQEDKAAYVCPDFHLHLQSNL